MRHVSGFFSFLVVLLLLCSSVFASEFGVDDMPTDPAEEATESLPSYVSLDPNTIQNLVDAFINAWDSRDALSDVDVTYPVIDISPDSVQSIAAGIGDAFADSQVPDVATNFFGSVSGGYYFVADCALGRGVKFWVPADFASGSIARDGNGLVNMTNSSIYLMPDSSSLSGYTIYASRFGHFQYRRAGYDYQDLNITNISDTNIAFLDSTLQAVPDSTYWIVLIVVCILGFLLIAFFKR